MTNIRWGAYGESGRIELKVYFILERYYHVIGRHCIISNNYLGFLTKPFSEFLDESKAFRKVYAVMGSACPADFVGCRFMDTENVDSVKSIAINLARTNDLIHESDALKKLPVDYRLIIVEKNKEEAEKKAKVPVLSVEELEEYLSTKFGNPVPTFSELSIGGVTRLGAFIFDKHKLI